MRLAAQMRGGFYPAPTEAIAHAATFLRPPVDQPFTILDPCAGEGAAIVQFGDSLGCPPATTFAIELDDNRATTLHVSRPDAHVLAPASFFGCRASFNTFSFIWLNPPFDYAYGGHRMEQQFLVTATDWLMSGGVMALVCPEEIVGEHTDVRRHFATYYEKVTVALFPERHRRFKEVIVFGQKRAWRHGDRERETSWEEAQAPAGFIYQIPPGASPRVFQKVEPTESELQRLLTSSPLRSRLTAAPRTPVPSPPLALGIGHVALLLASGHLDGVVQPTGKSPHVVRGTAERRNSCLTSPIRSTRMARFG